MSLTLIDGAIIGFSSIGIGPILIGLAFLTAATLTAYYRAQKATTSHPFEMLTIAAATVAFGIPAGAATTALALQTPGTYPVFKLTILIVSMYIGALCGLVLVNISDTKFTRRNTQHAH